MDIKLTDKVQKEIIKVRKQIASSSDVSEDVVAKRVTEIMLMQSQFTEMLCDMHEVSMKIVRTEINKSATQNKVSIEVLKKPLEVIIDNAEISAIYNILEARREKMILINQRDTATYKLLCELCAVYENSQNLVSVDKGGQS